MHDKHNLGNKEIRKWQDRSIINLFLVSLDKLKLPAQGIEQLADAHGVHETPEDTSEAKGIEDLAQETKNTVD